jgi:hypothetical protein
MAGAQNTRQLPAARELCIFLPQSFRLGMIDETYLARVSRWAKQTP